VYSIEVFNVSGKVKIKVEYNTLKSTIAFYNSYLDSNLKVFLASYYRSTIEENDKGIGLHLCADEPELYLDSDTMNFIFYWLGYLDRKLK